LGLQPRQKLLRLLDQMLIVVSRFLALMVFVAMHATTNKVIGWVLPEGWGRYRLMLEALFVIAFSAIYVIQVFEMVAVFVPALDEVEAKILGRYNSERG